jgi:hypothetical protein
MECDGIMASLRTHLEERYVCFPAGERFRITTPWKRPGGDIIDVYVRPQSDGTYVVSDLGESLGFLASMGFDPRGGSNSAFVLQHIPFRYNVELRAEGVLRKHVPEAELGDAIHSVTEASLAVSHMLYLSRASAPVTITDEVANALVVTEVVFEQNKQVVGESGHKFRVDFAIFGQQQLAQAYVKTLSAESPSGRLSAVNAAYRMWAEIQAQTGFSASIVDDRYSEWPSAEIIALGKFSTVFHWGADDEQQRFRESVRRFAVGLLGRPDESASSNLN